MLAPLHLSGKSEITGMYFVYRVEGRGDNEITPLKILFTTECSDVEDCGG